VAGSVGQCRPVSGAPRGARPACANDGSACGGVCDGTQGGACTYPAAETSCRSGSCAAGVAALAATCDGAGSCPAEQTVSCSPYACGATTCLGDCTGDGDCAGDHYCAAGVCTLRKGAGEPCGTPGQCQSGSCVDGVCCDSACTGQCEACDVAGSLGTCSAVTGAPHGARTACTSDGSACAGACDGASRDACAYPGGTTTCRAPSCADGVAVVAAACGGTGACPALLEESCAPYACGADACLTSCGGDADCAGGFTCSAGQCVTAGTGGAGLSVEGSGCGSGGSAGGPLLLLWLVALMPRLRRRGGGAALAGLGLTLLAAPLSAHAQAGNAPSFEVERFRPEGGARDVMGVPSASVPAHLEKHLSAWLSYADQPLRLTGTGSTPYDATLVRSQTTLQLGASIGLLDRYELAAMVPLTSASGDRPPGLSGVSLPDPGAALGDLGLSARAHLADLGPVGLAVAVPLRLPTGARSAYSGHGGVTGGLEALAEWRAPGELRALFSAGWVQRGERHLVDLTVGSALTFGLAAEVPLPVKLAGSPVVALSTLSGELGVGHGATASPMELLLAARARLPLGLEMTLGAGPGIGKGYGTPRFRALASLAFAPRSPPPPPVAAPEPPAPAPEPAVVAAAEPPPQPAADPLPPEPSAVVAEAPPAEAAPAPVPEPEAAPPQVVVTRERLVILQQVHFANDRDVILPDSFTLLDEVARVLVANPQIARVRVEGHTDSKGKPAYNTRLSKRRAAMVRGFLVKRGVEEGRLLAHGFGPERPIASNDTEEGRSRNRRVEFVILEER
jgi:outer membrane protein OmpA-like peptidoglycan-associated protein